MLWMGDDSDTGKGAEHDASMCSRCWQLSEVQKSEATLFLGGNGIHMYILYQASWWPQCVSTALGVPLSLKGQLCSHEAPANSTVEKPKGTKSRMSDASGGKSLLFPHSVDSAPLTPQSSPFALCRWVTDLVHFHPWAVLTFLYYKRDFSWAPPGGHSSLFKASHLGSGGK